MSTDKSGRATPQMLQLPLSDAAPAGFGGSQRAAEPAKPAEFNLQQLGDLGFTIRSAFGTPQEYLAVREMARDLAKSDLLPDMFRGSPENILFAHDIALRIQEPLVTVIHNLAPITDEETGETRLRWRPKFLIALINRSPKFQDGLQFRETGEGDSRGIQAFAIRSNGTEAKGPEINLRTVRLNGWNNDPDSPWNRMTDMMLHYRSAEYFANIHCPELESFLGFFGTAGGAPGPARVGLDTSRAQPLAEVRIGGQGPTVAAAGISDHRPAVAEQARPQVANPAADASDGAPAAAVDAGAGNPKGGSTTAAPTLGSQEASPTGKATAATTTPAAAVPKKRGGRTAAAPATLTVPGQTEASKVAAAETGPSTPTPGSPDAKDASTAVPQVSAEGSPPPMSNETELVLDFG